MSSKEYERLLKGMESTNMASSGESGDSITPKMLVKSWLDQQNISIDYKERVRWDRYLDPSMSAVLSNLYEDYLASAQTHNIKKGERFTDKELSRGLDLCILDIKDAHKGSFIESLKTHPTIDPGLTELHKFCKCIVSEDFELAFCAIHHFIWQVKRKVFGRPVTRHMMTILRGDQGCGKTQALSRLLGPVRDYVYNGPVSTVQKENSLYNYHNNYVARCEELERVDKTDKNALKGIITADTVSYRIYYEQRTAERAQNCTFIGTSNDDITDLFRDFSGMRRFIQINTRSVTDMPKYWKTINSIDYNKIWKSVGYDDTPPILQVIDSGALKEHQEELTPKTSVQEWLISNELAVGNHDVKQSILYNLYRGWCSMCGMSPCSAPHFGKELLKNGFERSRKRQGDNRFVFYKCNKPLGDIA